MNERKMRGVHVLYAYAALQLGGCMQGDVDVDVDGDDDPSALAQMDHATHDGGMHGGMHMGKGDGGMHMGKGDGGMHMGMGDGGMHMGMGDAGHAHAADAGAHEHEEEDGDGCGADHPTYRPGLSYKAGDLTIVVTKMVPAPPRQFANNDWTLLLFDKSGAPLTGATITNADSYMEVHAHSGNTRPVVVALPEPGQFRLDDIDFKMRGPWEVLFDVTPQGATRAIPVTLKICVE